MSYSPSHCILCNLFCLLFKVSRKTSHSPQIISVTMAGRHQPLIRFPLLLTLIGVSAYLSGLMTHCYLMVRIQ